MERDMNTQPPSPTRRRGEQGYVLATTALMLVPMMLFAAFAVDLGAWYHQGSRTQRAADAAALAAVVWMPDLTEARSAALEAAERNGFVAGVDGTTINVEAVDEQQVRVTIQSPGTSFFSNIIDAEVDIERFATAEYILPVAMGNPTSALGTGVDSDHPSGVTEGFWLNALPRSNARHAGDLISSINGAGGVSNGAYDENGYLFVVDVPASGSWNFQIRPSCFEQNDGTMRIKLFAPDATEFNDYDNIEGLPVALPTSLPLDGNGFAQISRAASCNGGAAWDKDIVDPAPWTTLANVGATPGRWVFQMQQTTSARALYSLRVVDGAGNTCTRAGAAANPNCPNISARNWLGAFTQWKMFSDSQNIAGSETSLYLAEVGDEHQGKTLEVIMFDPADGVDDVKILLPGGTEFASFSWDTLDVERWGYQSAAYDTYSQDYPTDGSLVTQTCADSALDADVDPESCVTTPTGNRSWFQDRTVRIQIPIPDTYTCGTDCWWRLVYRNVNNTNETTTWQARIIGDPVHLIE